MDDKDLEYKLICLYKLGAKDNDVKIPREGVGNCYECTPDEKNKYCKMYSPIKFYTINII